MNRLKSLILLGSLVAFFMPAVSAALPSHFGDKVENALVCRSEWSTEFWRNYFRQYLNQPVRTWGEAEWFNAQKADLAGNPAEEVFVNLPDSGALMVGALIKKPLAEVKKNIETRLGVSFVALAGPYPRWLSKFGSVLVEVGPEETKWYCARWNLGNRP
ncbi:hypothetical protein HQ393_08180 [Chitinibacter bivalviorum]|uniref:Uncharacterized protein n=1 Tax=Chitinibacter bivalviorum TaxID=2739434 RepID=A0A7H9BI63_9NEIS|nr:hypothetical protein [Chitinibacter bivalviorum]QLG88229.1 hypothetical protein HQ393_08180 [Chitinibacter bivalviorum]